ncbi:hypothetical protein OCU04_008527 [Sclerotinia nivalis]|uniref:NAD(P)-binding domain-containing protein n=1 Tax=Sclerotinia nivalis TaxID=352851 RepID=A0A9X0AI91_9HELO|nr:hypothetical protein OCU04_008527 [Sclerotinia nivalis]
MKLIVTGATGFVGTEVIRQALRNPAVTSVVALSRKPVVPPNDAGDDTSKLESIILDDWSSPYPESVKEKIKGADGCIWTLAITPSRSKAMEFAEVTKVCYEYTVNGITNMAAVANTPFRFIYTSGALIERDQSKSLTFMADYRHMRGRTENAILDFAVSEHAPDIQVTVAKPGIIDGPNQNSVVSTAMKSVYTVFGNSPKVHVSEIAAAMISQCLNGVTKDPLWGDDLAKIGQGILSERDYLK